MEAASKKNSSSTDYTILTDAVILFYYENAQMCAVLTSYAFYFL